MANAKRSFRIRSRELEKLEIQSLDFLQDLSESRRSKRRRVRSPVLTMEEKIEMQKKQQKESRSRRALERELKFVGSFDESMFKDSTRDSKSSSLETSNSNVNFENGNPENSLQSVELTDSREDS